MGISYNPSIVTEGLVLALDPQSTRSYVGSGTTWTDLTNRGNSGTLTNGPVFIPGGPFNNSGGSVYFDGTGDYVTIASSSDFIFDGDFTIEYWIYREGGNVWFDLSNASSYTNAIQFYSSSGNFHFYMNSSTATNVGGAGYMDVPTSQWVHHAVSRSGTTCRVFADGVLKKTTTLSGTAGNDANNILRLGAQTYGGPTAYFQGYLSNLRIVKGTAVYTSAFTPPTGPLEAIDDTVLLTCQGGAITDNGPNSHAITVTNDAEAITASAFELDGTDDYVDIGASSDFNIGTGDFTVEGWVNTSVYGSDGAYRRVFMLDGPTGNANGNFQIILNAPNGRIYAWSNTGELNYIGSSVIADGSWNHFAACRIGSVIYLYVNGDSSGSVSSSVSFTANSGSPRPRIGAYSSSSGRLNGKVSALKIYKGKGLTEDEVKRNFSALRGRYGI